MLKIKSFFQTILHALTVISLVLYQLSFGLIYPGTAYAASPVFVNNGTANSGNVYPSSQNVLGLNISLPPIDSDTFIDGDGTVVSTGTLDTTWDTDGIQTYNSSAGSDIVKAVLFDSVNSKFYVAGYQQTNGYDAVVLRYNADGSLDTTWDSDGIATFNSGGTQIDEALAIAFDSANNKLYVGGQQGTNGEDILIMRYNADGSLDTSWDGDGIVTHNSSGTQSDIVQALVLDSGNSKLYAAGVYGTGGLDFAVLRYNLNGALDTSWDSDGIATYNSGGSQIDMANAIAFDSGNNKLYVAGEQGTNGKDFAVLRYDSTGALDTSWDSDGIQTFNSGSTQEDIANGLAFDSANNKLYVIGQQATNGIDFTILRYGSTGALDTSWDSDGIQTFNSGGVQQDTGYAIAFDSANSKVYVLGVQGTNGNDILVLRYTTGGALDSTWDSDGIQSYNSGSSQGDAALAGYLDAANNKLYAAGYVGVNTQDFVVLRYFINNAGNQETIAAGTALSKLAMPAGTALCGNTNGTTAPANIVYEPDGDCRDGLDVKSLVDSVGNVGTYSTSLALDTSGFPVVSYYDETNGNLKILHCNDTDCVGGNESIEAVDTIGDVGRYPSLRLDSLGYPVVSYFDGTNGNLKILHCNDANCAGGNENISTVDSTGIVGYYTSLALDENGYPVVGYYDFTNQDFKILHCNDANCAGGDESIETVDSIGNIGYDQKSLALDNANPKRPVVSYHDDTNGDLKILHCNDANCAGGDESIVAVDTTGDVGNNSSLVLDSSGFPVVAYDDVTNTNLKILHCNDANCAGGNENIVVVDGDPGSLPHPSIALDASAFPVVSYRAPFSNLKILHCSDVNCAGGSIVEVSDGDSGGYYSSLALDGFGFPVVSSYDVINTGLRVLHCGDVNCAADGRTVVLGTDTGATNDLAATASLIAFRDTSSNGTWASGEDLYLDVDDSGWYNRDELDAITVRNAGTAIDTIDIAVVKMWLESSLNNTFGTDDVLVDSICGWDGIDDWQCGDNTSVTITGAGSISRIYITYDVAGSNSVTFGNTIQLRVATLSDSGTTGAFDTGDTGIFFSKAGAANTGNHDGPTSAITNDSTNTIAVLSGSTATPTQNGVPIIGGVPETPLITNTETKTIDTDTGGSVTETAANDGSTATVSVEPETTSADTSFTVETYIASEVFNDNPLPSGLDAGTKAVYDIVATAGGENVETFSKPLELTFSYLENNLSSGVNEGDLRLAVFDEVESNWYVLEDAVVNTSTNTISYVSDHLTRFAIVRPADIIRPSLPTNVAAVAVSGGAKLSWQNPPTDFHHVRITRGLTAQDAGTLIAGDVRGTSYEDISVSNEPVYYNLVSVDLAGNRSGPAMVLFDPSLSSYSDGDLLRGESTSEVWIIHNSGGKMFKRHVLFSNFDTFYPHLALFWSNVKVVSDSTVAVYSLSAWIRLDGTSAVYEINDDNTKHWITCADDSVIGQDCANEWILSGRDFDGVYIVNSTEFNSYVTGPTVIMPDVEN